MSFRDSGLVGYTVRYSGYQWDNRTLRKTLYVSFAVEKHKLLYTLSRIGVISWRTAMGGDNDTIRFQGSVMQYLNLADNAEKYYQLGTR